MIKKKLAHEKGLVVDRNMRKKYSSGKMKKQNGFLVSPPAHTYPHIYIHACLYIYVCIYIFIPDQVSRYHDQPNLQEVQGCALVKHKQEPEDKTKMVKEKKHSCIIK